MEDLKPQEDFGLPLLRQFALLLTACLPNLFGNLHEF
jgi:hypothetical protein